MALSVRKISLWRTEVDNRPGMLAQTLSHLAQSGADLRVVMGYRLPGHESRAALELYPVTTKKAAQAAGAAGLSPSGIPTLLLEGDNRPGLGHAITLALADEGINLTFLVTQVIGRRYTSVIGFESEEALRRASSLIRKVVARKR